MSQEIVQIHKMKSTVSFRFIEDPQTGAQQRQQVERFVPDDTDRIVSGDETYEVHPDRSFYVPKSVADHLTRMPDWHVGPNPFAPDPDEQEERPRSSARKPTTAKGSSSK